jgi:two-component system chemotaxis response regulator CheB
MRRRDGDPGGEGREIDRAETAEERAERAQERAERAREEASAAENPAEAERRREEARVHERAVDLHEQVRRTGKPPRGASGPRVTGPGPSAKAIDELEDRPETEPVLQRDLIVVGASAGGVQTLQQLVAELPAELPASILVVLHLASSSASVLHQILSRAGELPVTQAVDGEPLERGHVYVAPPDRHLLVRGPNVHLSDGPRENGHRPAVNPLFRSAARAFGPRVVGVVLTGTLDDGTDGLRLIKQRGGAAVVQSPDDAEFSEMPESAIELAGPDHVVSIARMGQVLCNLVDEPLEPHLAEDVPDLHEQVDDQVEAGDEARDEGRALRLTCPDCGKRLIEHEEDGGVVRFACPAGHAYLPESLVEQQGDALESALWQALRTMEERADLLMRMARQAERRGMGETRSRLEQQAGTVTRHAVEIRNTIIRLRGTEPDEEASVKPMT